jgi:glyoxylase-like metal-dependent hydrolase (beta-lactamase superfamily II)
MKSALPRKITRRGLLQGLGYCAAAQALAKAPVAPLTSALLAPNLLWIRGAGSNVLALKDPRGLTFIDGGLAANASAVLKLAKSALGAADAHTVIDTHWHPEPVGLNEPLGKAGAKIIAHENTRLWLSTPVEVELDRLTIRPLAPKARPNSTTYTEDEFSAGGEVVHYGHLAQAHTDGDLYVHLRESNVLLTGGVVAGRGWSTVDYVTGGWINGLVGGQRALLGICDADTRIVSAYGDRLLTRKDLEDEHAMLAKLSEQLAKMLRSGFAPADVLAAAPAKEYEPRYGDSARFLEQSFRSLWGHMAPDA